MKNHNGSCFAIRKALTKRQEYILLVCSFALPLLLWCLVSYVPFLYHPLVRVTDSGDSFLCARGDLIERSAFERENKELSSAGEAALPGAFPGGKGIVSSLLKCTHKRLQGSCSSA